jgi:2-amino-4-hydroxy-6-hydroxymethyldihydropteridine diphosphokinase
MLAPSRRTPASAWRPDAAAAPATVYIGLGSNLGDRLGTLQAAARLLRDGAVPGTVLVRCSPVYETRPLGPSIGAYLNAVAELRTVAEPTALLAALLELELRHGRTRRERWASRTLDLDVLVWEGERGMVELEGPPLRLPHPELERRDFVLAPLVALAPELRPRGAASVTELLAALGPAERTIVAQLTELLC